MSWGLVLPFDTDSADFARGVEVGAMWGAVTATGGYEGQVRSANAEMVMRVAEATGRQFRAEALDDDWLEVRIW